MYSLFEQQKATVAGWIRHRRLERCRRDLLDPCPTRRARSAPSPPAGARQTLPASDGHALPHRNRHVVGWHSGEFFSEAKTVVIGT
jgi:hypothetical protein